MKKCPVCDKTFDDSMRFCQTDGTALAEAIEETPEDPFKTMVARPEDDFSSAIPSPSDPFKTMVAGSQPREESGDLLQLPEEYDALKTSVVSQSEMQNELGISEPKQDAASDFAPPSPFGSADAPFESPKAAESPNIFSDAPPDPPKFNEPSLNPPDFGGSSENATEIMSSSDPFSAGTDPFAPSSPASKDPWNSSPFNQPNESAIPSPFGDAPPSAPVPPYKEPEPPTVLGGNPFEQPPSFGHQDPFNQPFNPSAQQNEWAPPPAPVSNWQDQGLGANTPFQPPMSTQGQDSTLAIVSLVCGILSVCACGFLAGIPAIITGFMARNKISENPAMYGGGGMALAGMILGGISIVFSILYVLFLIVANS